MAPGRWTEKLLLSPVAYVCPLTALEDLLMACVLEDVREGVRVGCEGRAFREQGRGLEAQGGWDLPGLQQAPRPYLPKKQEEVKVHGPPVSIFRHWGYKYTVHHFFFFFCLYILVFT